MKKNKGQKHTLMKSLIVPLMAVAILQAVVFYGTLALTNTTEILDITGENNFAHTASERTAYLETEMTRSWSNLASVTEAANQKCAEIMADGNITVNEFLSNNVKTHKFLLDISDDMLDTLRMNSVNGVFLVLSDSDGVPDRSASKSYQGLFFKDSDVNDTPSDYSDIMLERGPAAAAADFDIPLDFSWSREYQYSPEVTDMDFFFTVTEAAHAYPGISGKSLGLWSGPFYLSYGNEFETERIITYSEPLVYNGSVYGVIGVSVSISNFMEYLSGTEEKPSDNSFYMLADLGEQGNSAYIRAISESRTGINRYEGNTMNFEDTDRNVLKKIKSAEINGEPAYCAVNVLNIYANDSPYEQAERAVIAVTDEDSIYGNSGIINRRLFAALLIAVIIGAGTVYFTAKYTSKPIKALADSLKTSGTNNVIDVIDTRISEISDLSVTLNELSEKRIEYQNKLITERERYLIALRNVDGNLLEYDCQSDIFYTCYFRKNAEDDLVTRKFENFRSLIETGQVCPPEYIPDLIDFISGKIDENGIVVKIIDHSRPSGYMWSLTKSKSVYDSSGRLIRVIASAKDITEQKELELARLDRERRDPVTSFYKMEYGKILASRYIIETGDKPTISAIIKIEPMEQIFMRYGQIFCDAIFEEASVVIRKYALDDFIIYRGIANEFVVLTELSSKDDARSLFRAVADEIENIYRGEIDLEVFVGLYLKTGNENLTSSRAKTRLALEAAEKFRDELGNVVFEDEIADRTDFVNDFNANYKKPESMVYRNSITDNTDIVSFTFSLFEKTEDFGMALKVFLQKAGRTLNASRIIIFDINRDYNTVRILDQWHRADIAPIEVKTYTLGKARIAEIDSGFRAHSCMIADKAHYEKDACPDSGKMVSDGTAYTIPMFDNDTLMGTIVYECCEEETDEFISCLSELTKIVSAYISKSRTSAESRAKSEFLSKMSHEIRTPMNAIIGMTEIALSSDDVSPRVNDCLKKIDSSSHYLLSIINDILDMSRIESGKMTTEETYFNLDELIEHTAAMISVQTESKGIWFRVEKDTPHIHLLGDPLKLKQVLINIMGNAVKFTSKGGIHLRISEAESEIPGVVNVSFSIKDTGIGISEENIGKVFNSFEQADANTVRKYGGTGLGLAISSNLVQLLGGKLEVQSKLGEGSEFFFTLPMKITEPVETDSREGLAEVDFASKRILIVEDDELNIEIARTLIEAQGIKTEVAENGSEAVEKFGSSDIGYFDAILMDIRMPVMGGIEATKAIRDLDREDASSVPIVAMTANAFDEDMKKSVECGMNGHLTKPIDMNEVMKMFRRIWS